MEIVIKQQTADEVGFEIIQQFTDAFQYKRSFSGYYIPRLDATVIFEEFAIDSSEYYRNDGCNICPVGFSYGSADSFVVDEKFISNCIKL